MPDRMDMLAAPDLSLVRSLAGSACSCTGNLLPHAQCPCWQLPSPTPCWCAEECSAACLVLPG